MSVVVEVRSPSRRYYAIRMHPEDFRTFLVTGNRIHADWLPVGTDLEELLNTPVVCDPDVGPGWYRIDEVH